MIYREATLEDLSPKGVDLVAEGMQEVTLGEEAFSPDRSLETLIRMVNDPGCLVGVADTGNTLAGVIIASAYDSMFSDSIYATMHVWYVRPAHRGGWTGYRLARIYRDWAHLIGAKTAYMDVNSGVDNEMASKLAYKLGFRQIGTTHKAMFQ